MASNSPGDETKDKSQEKENSNFGLDPPLRPRVGARSSLSDKVGFFEQVFSKNRQRSRSRGKDESVRSAGANSGTTPASSHVSRVEVGYHGPRTDARDRSSEDPRHHRIPRASLSPTLPEDGDGQQNPRKKIRSRSASRGREMDRSYSRDRSYDRDLRSRSRGSRERSTTSDYVTTRTLRDRLEDERFQRHSDRIHDDIPSSPYRSIQIKRTQSGRMIESHRGGAAGGHYRAETKPRALSFRVSPTKTEMNMEDVHQPMEPIFGRRTTPTRDQSMSITQHIQAKVASNTPLYQKPPPLPERPPRHHQRHSEPLMYPSQQVRK